MASNQGSPGVSISITDNSGYTSTSTPLTISGYVGHSQKGIFNRISSLSSVGQIDKILGNGFQNPKLNQALYGVRGALNAGGGAEFVRVYSETPDLSNGKGLLKSDVFYATFDTSTKSIDLDYCVATTNVSGTQYKDPNSVDLPGASYIDRFAEYGSREIYDISTVIASNKRLSDIELDSDFVGNKIPLFSIVPADPTLMNRGPLADKLVVNTAAIDTYLSSSSLSISFPSVCADGDTITFFGSTGLVFEFDSDSDVGAGNIAVTIASSGATADTCTTAFKTALTAEIASNDLLSGLKVYQVGTSELLLSYQGFDKGAVTKTGTSIVISGTTLGKFLPDLTYNASISIKNEAGVSVITDGDTIELFGNTIEFLIGSSTVTTVGNIPIKLNSLDNVTSGQIANAVIGSINSLGIKGLSVIGSSVVSGTETKISLEYIGIGIISKAISYTTVTTSTGGIVLVDFYSDGVEQEDNSYDNVLLSNSLGIEFNSLGLVTELVFESSTGGNVKKYQLTDEGEVVARTYMTIDLVLGGTTYNFSGTLVPYATGSTNLYIIEQLYSYKDIFVFTINESDSFEDGVVDGLIDISGSKLDGFVSATFEQEATDTAIEGLYNLETGELYNSSTDTNINTVTWQYDPKNNMSSSGFQSAWDLFLDKDSSNAFILCSAGSNILNFGSKKYEQLDVNVCTKMLDVCEKRKDRVSILDTISNSDVDVVIRKTSALNSLSNELGRWGAIYDSRSIKLDTEYTKLQVEVAKSVAVTNRIISNSLGGLWWLPPAGFDEGGIGSTDSVDEKTVRTYNYPKDLTSDIAKLYAASINPTRITQGGAYLYGQRTLQKKETAFDRLNVALLIAGIHKEFETYLDRKVFKLNTREFRSEIQEELNAKLNFIRTAPQPGITTGYVKCDSDNNTSSIIAQKKLVIDILDLRATSSSEFIDLRTTIETSGDGETIITSEII